MTSRIASFDEQPAFLAAFAAHPYREFSKEQLVSYAIGAPATPPGWRYSNTGYILAEMIIEKATRDSYEHQGAPVTDHINDLLRSAYEVISALPTPHRAGRPWPG